MLSAALVAPGKSKPLGFTPLILLLTLVGARSRARRPHSAVAHRRLPSSGTMASLWMAKRVARFTKGLDVEMISMGSDPSTALIANEVDVIQVSAAPVIIAATRLTWSFLAECSAMIWDLYARPKSSVNS